jgi:hypothetical protein
MKMDALLADSVSNDCGNDLSEPNPEHFVELSEFHDAIGLMSRVSNAKAGCHAGSARIDKGSVRLEVSNHPLDPLGPVGLLDQVQHHQNDWGQEGHKDPHDSNVWPKDVNQAQDSPVDQL